MTKIDIFSGFLGAGKTTLIKKLIKEAYQGEKLVLIENEFGEIGVDGGFLQDAGVKINELNSGCICCSLVGDFAKALQKVYGEYRPDRILIEPSGVGKLSDVMRAVESANLPDSKINAYTAVVDASKCKTYMRNFGEFFNDQIESASCIVFSHADTAGAEKLDTALALVRERNPRATVVTTPWEQLDGKELLSAIERSVTLESRLGELAEEEHACRHGHHHEDHDGECCHGQHHEDRDGECCHGHHHDHHRDHEHHHHHADEVFSSWGKESGKQFGEEQLKSALSALSDADKYGTVLRAKGIVPCTDGSWIHFDYIPGEADVRRGGASYTGRLCVIGSKLNEGALQKLFGL